MRLRHVIPILALAAAGAARVNLPGLVREMDISGAIQGENIRFDLRLAYAALPRGTNVCVLDGEVALLEAHAPRDVRLRRAGRALLLEPLADEAASRGELRLSFAVRTAVEGDWRRARFSVPVLPVRRLTVQADRPEVEIRFPEGRALRREAGPGGAPKASAFLGLSPWVDVAWRPEIRRIDGELVATCEINAIATASPGALRLDGVYNYRIAQGTLSELVFDLPEVNVLRVTGRDIQDWRIDRTDPAKPVLRVALGRPQSERYAVEIEVERALPAFPCEVQVPVLAPRGMIRSGGSLAVGTDSAVKLQAAAAAGLTQIDQAGFPRVASLAGDGAARPLPGRGLFAYQYAAVPYTLNLSADLIATALSADLGLVVNVADGQVSVDATVQLEVRDAPAREVRLLTSAAAPWTVIGVTGRQVAETDVDVRDTAGGREIVVPFKQPVEGTVSLNLRLERPVGKGTEPLAVPAVSVAEARTQRGYVVAAAERGIRLVPKEATELRDVHTASLPQRVEGAQLAYRFRQPGWKLSLGLEWATSAIHAEMFHLVSLGDGVVYVSAAFNGHVSGAPVQTLRFRVPASIGNMDVVGPGIDTWSRSNDVCTVQLATRAMGDLTLLLTYDQPLPYGGALLPVGEIEVLDSASELGFITVATSANLSVEEPGDLPATLIRIRRDELPEGYAATVTAPVIAAYKYTRRPHAATLRVAPLETRRPIDQVVDYLSLHTRIGRDGETVTRAVYSVKNTSRQYLALRLPAGASLWSVRQGADADARDVPAQQATDRLLVPVERPRDPNQAVPLTVEYATAAPARRAARVELTAPVMLDTPVTFARWEVEAGDRRAIVSASGNLTPEPSAAKPLPCALPWESPRPARFYRTAQMAGEEPLRLTIGLAPLWRAGGSLAVLGGGAAAGLLLLVAGLRRRRNVWLALGLAALGLAAAQTRIGAVAAAVVVAGLVPVALLAGFVRLLMRSGQRLRESLPDNGPPLRGEGGPGAPSNGGWVRTPVLLVVAFLLAAAATLAAAEAAKARPPTAEAGKTAPPVAAAAGAAKAVPFRCAHPEAGDRDEADADISLLRTEATVQAPAPDPRAEASAGVSWKLLVHALRPGRLPLFPSSTVVVAARLNHPRLQLAGTAEGVAVEVAAAGDYAVEFDCREPIAECGGEWTLELPWPRGLVNRLLFEVPAADMDVRSEQAASLTVQSAAGATKAAAAVAPAAAVTVVWRPRARDTRAEKTVAYAEMLTLARVRPGVIDLQTRAEFAIVQGERREFALTVPAGLTVTSVSAPGLATWRFDPATRRIEIILARPASGTLPVDIGLQAPCSGLPFDTSLGVIAAEGVERQRGRLALAASESVLLRVGEAAGVAPIDNADFRLAIEDDAKRASQAAAAAAAEPVRRAFRYDAPEAVKVPVHAEAVLPELRVSESSSLSIGDERNVLSSTLEITVAKAGVFSLRLRIPEGYDIETLTGRDVSHWDDARRAEKGVEVFLKRRVQDQTALSLVLSRPQRGVPPAIEVPRLGVEGAARHAGRIAVSAERGTRLSVVKQDGGVAVRRPEGEKLAPGTLAFDLLRPDWSLTLEAQVLAPAIKPELLHRVELAEGMLQHRVYLRYRIENAGVKFFRVRIPSRDAPLTVTGRNIARVRPLDEAGGGATGRVWEVELHGKVEDAYALTCQYQEPYDAARGEVDVLPFEVLGAARQSGFLVLTGGGRVEVEPRGEPEGLKAEDARTLPDDFGAGDLSSAIRCYRALRPDYRLGLRVVRHGAAQVLPASVERVRLVSTLSGSGRLLTQISMTLQAGNLRFLRVELPSKDSALWSAQVNGVEARVSRDTTRLNVPLEGAGAGQATAVTLVYADGLPDGRLTGRHTLRAARFPDLPLRDISWSLFVPPEYRCRFYDSDLDPLARSISVRRFERADYESANKRVQDASIEAAKGNLKALDGLLSSGKQREARQALQQAVNLSQAEQTLNEDARVQLRNVVRQQIKMGLVNRREALRADNNIFDESAPAMQSAGFNGGNFNSDFVRQVDEQLTVQDRSALDLVAQKMADQQGAAAVPATAITIAMPEHGREFPFARALQNAPGGELRIAFRASRPLALPAVWRLWPVLPAFLGLWLLLRIGLGRSRGRVSSE
jgi:hypothetical protein